jgi:hypothetical protein
LPTSAEELSPNQLHFLRKVRIRGTVYLSQLAALLRIKAARRGVDVLSLDFKFSAAS